jgi:S1-C subfamily serine protease
MHLDPSKIQLGVNCVSLPDTTRAKLQQNTGVIVVGVIQGTPAFKANILRDDVLLEIGGEEIVDRQGFDRQLTKFEGQRVEIELLRGDERKAVSVTLRRRSLTLVPISGRFGTGLS